MSSRPANTSVYASTIHCSWLLVASRSRDDRRDRDVEDRVVEHDHEQAEAEDGEDPPPALVGAILRRGALRVPVMRGLPVETERSRNGTEACRFYWAAAYGRHAPRRSHPADAATSGQPHVGRRDATLRVEHALEHRRVRLGEAGLHDRQQRLGVRAAVVDLAREPALDHRDEPLGAHVRGGADRAGAAHEHRAGTGTGPRRRAPRSRAAHRRGSRACRRRARRRPASPRRCWGAGASSSMPAGPRLRPVRTGML